jgi:hypothetical protein
MFKSIATATIVAAVSVLAACTASPPSGSVPVGETADAAAVDSLGGGSYEELFIDLHGEIVRKLDRSPGDRNKDIVLIEVQSIVTIAEEMYLEGNIQLAVKLLREANLLLRQTP